MTKFKIKDGSQIVANNVICKALAVIIPSVMVLTLGSLLIENIVLHGIISTLLGCIPIIGLLWISKRLPIETEKFVRERLPDHIEYASIMDLRCELLSRERGVLIQDDERNGHIIVLDSYTKDANEVEMQRLWAAADKWARMTADDTKNRGAR